MSEDAVVASRAKFELVLILILMEYVRRQEILAFLLYNIESLNPYSNGICPKTSVLVMEMKS